MGRARKQRRRRGPALAPPEALIEALVRLERGPLDSGPALTRIAKGVQALHRGLTVERGRFVGGGYLRDAAMASAYGTYYLCANLPKVWPLLDKAAHRGLISPERALKVLELGAGPGTGSVALMFWALERGWPAPTIHLTDVQPQALARARRLWKALGWPPASLSTAVVDVRQAISGQMELRSFDLVLSCNMFNEVPEGRDGWMAAEIATMLKPTGLWLSIEPAERQISRRALRLRDAAVAGRWQVVMPCTHLGKCPALEAEGDWCHGEWNFERPAFMVEVDRRVGTRREVLKATWWAALPPRAMDHPRAPRPMVPPEGLSMARIVSERFDEKGRTAVVVCDGDGRRRLELQRRDAAEHHQGMVEGVRHDLVAITPGVAGRLAPEARCLPIIEAPPAEDELE